MPDTRTYLKLVFTTQEGGTHTISLRDPKSNLTSQEVSQVMQNIVSRNIILASSGELTGIKEAYISGTTVTEILP
ncbi:MAG: DUF2922 domain-containing protein [Caldiserica bacterium]|jgi:hypothetical protein|nr:DUF2922 domain-containing protein [Caldisericota bacterium]